VTLTGSNGATAVLDAASSTCDDAQPSGDNLDDTGQCIVVFSSATAGTVTGDATVNLSVGGISLTRNTDGVSPNSDDAVKTYVDGSLRWLKHDNNGQLLGGATFQVCRTHTYNSATDTFVDTADACVTVLDNSAPDNDPTAGEFELIDLVLGRYTITETIAPPTYTLDPFVETIDLTIANKDRTATHTWINTPGGEGCTPGFWKNHTSAWDSTSDPTVADMPDGTGAGGLPYEFTTATLFNQYFGLTSAQSGFSDSATMLDAVNANGGGTKKLARHGVSALLNEASVNYPIPPSIDTAADDFIDLYNAIRNAYVSGVYEPLATQLGDNNELPHTNCPI
jgi:hypothetical protein